MNIEQLIFYILAAFSLLSAAYVVFSQNLIRSVFMFFVTLLCVAGLYVFAIADFVALTQIVIYVGGVLVLLLFAFMLSSKDSLDNLNQLQKVTLSANRIPGTLVCLLLLILIITLILKVDFNALNWITNARNTDDVKSVYENNINNIGVNLMSKFLLPFEMISILLMMVLVGAAHIARKEIKI